jgi:hypothetical protein
MQLRACTCHAVTGKPKIARQMERMSSDQAAVQLCRWGWQQQQLCFSCCWHRVGSLRWLVTAVPLASEGPSDRALSLVIQVSLRAAEVAGHGWELAGVLTERECVRVCTVRGKLLAEDLRVLSAQLNCGGLE